MSIAISSCHCSATDLRLPRSSWALSARDQEAQRARRCGESGGRGRWEYSVTYWLCASPCGESGDRLEARQPCRSWDREVSSPSCPFGLLSDGYEQSKHPSDEPAGAIPRDRCLENEKRRLQERGTNGQMVTMQQRRKATRGNWPHLEDMQPAVVPTCR
jgi:hypothetical protein